MSHVGSTAECTGLVLDEPEFKDIELKPSQEPLHTHGNKPLAPLQSLTDSLPLHDCTVHVSNHLDGAQHSGVCSRLCWILPVALRNCYLHRRL